MIQSLTATEDQLNLQIHWENGDISTLTASDLRREARDAWSIRQRLDQGEVKIALGLKITGLSQVGAQGVNVHFSDGHDRAIYPFSYLRELSDRFDK